MNRQDVHVFIKALGGKNAIIEDHDGWSNTNCCLSRWTHERGTDNSPSFGVSIQDAKQSRFHCFTCGSRGTLDDLVGKLERLSGKAYPTLRKYVEEEEFGGIIPDWDECEDDDEVEVVSTPKLSEDTIYMYDLAEGHSYLRGRGISKKVSIALGLRLETGEDTRDGRERILFPVYTLDGEEVSLVGFTGRATDTEKILKVRDYYGLKKTEALLGVERLRKEDSYIAVVEGLFAYARLASYGIPAVAIMGSHLSTAQAQMLLTLGKPVYLMFDNDKAGFKARGQSSKVLQGYIPVYIPTYPEDTEGLDPDQLTEDEVKLMIEEAGLI